MWKLEYGQETKYVLGINIFGAKKSVLFYALSEINKIYQTYLLSILIILKIEVQTPN